MTRRTLKKGELVQLKPHGIHSNLVAEHGHLWIVKGFGPNTRITAKSIATGEVRRYFTTASFERNPNNG